jgi:hypothetical protein
MTAQSPSSQDQLTFPWQDSERHVILPPFEAAITPARVGSVMNSYADVDNVPAGADSWLLIDLLRDQWGFGGTVVSDYWAVPFQLYLHDVVASVTRPVKQLADFTGVYLGPGEEAEVSFPIGCGPDSLHRSRSAARRGAWRRRHSRRPCGWGPALPGPGTADRADSRRGRQ